MDHQLQTLTFWRYWGQLVALVAFAYSWWYGGPACSVACQRHAFGGCLHLSGACASGALIWRLACFMVVAVLGGPLVSHSGALLGCLAPQVVCWIVEYCKA